MTKSNLLYLTTLMMIVLLCTINLKYPNSQARLFNKPRVLATTAIEEGLAPNTEQPASDSCECQYSNASNSSNNSFTCKYVVVWTLKDYYDKDEDRHTKRMRIEQVYKISNHCVDLYTKMNLKIFNHKQDAIDYRQERIDEAHEKKYIIDRVENALDSHNDLIVKKSCECGGQMDGLDRIEGR
jgi:hypothetical protein